MEYKQAHEAALAGKMVKFDKLEKWMSMNNQGFFFDPKTGETIHVLPKVYLWKTWEIKQEDVFVWGVCNRHGASWLATCKPAHFHKGEFTVGSGGQIMSMGVKDLFTDQPQKYILTPVNDDGTVQETK